MSDGSAAPPAKGSPGSLDLGYHLWPEHSSTGFLPSPSDPQWRVTLYWGEVDGRTECVGVGLVHVAQSEALTATKLRRLLPLASLVDQQKEARFESTTPRSPASRPTGTRPRYSREFYQEVADRYREALKAGLAPTRAVHEHFGAPTRRTAAGWVQRARQLGFLPPTEKRRPRA